MKPSPKQIKSSKRKVPRFFLLIAFCLLPVPFCLPLHAPLPAAAQAIDSRKAEADRLFNQGIQQFESSQFEAAMSSWQQALQIYRAINDRQGEMVALGNLSNVHTSLGNNTKAIEYAHQALAIAQKVEDRRNEGNALGNLGTAYRALGHYTKAIEYAQQSLVIAREIKDYEGEGRALGSLGLTYLDLSNYPKAIEYTQQWLAITRAVKDRRSEGVALGNLGIAYRSLSNFAKAIEYAQQWLKIAEETRDLKSMGEARGSLGLVYLYMGNYAKAIGYTEQWLGVARVIKDRQSEGRALGNLTSAYHSLGIFAKAIESAQQVLAIAQEIKDRQSESKALGSLGNIYFSLSDHDKAINYTQQSLVIAREIKDRQREGDALGSLGANYFFLNDYIKASDYTQQSLSIAREIKNRQGEGGALGALGVTYVHLGNYAKALEYSQQSLAVAREIKDRQSESDALINLGFIYSHLGDHTKTIQYGQQAIVIAQEIGDRQGVGAAFSNLGVAFLKTGNPTEAEKMLVQGIQVWESLRQLLGSSDANKVSIFEGQATTYRTLQQVRVAQNNPNAALEIAERGRARAFVDLLTQRLSSGDASSVIAAAPNQDQIRQIAKAQNATLVQYSIIYDGFQIQGRQVARESALYIWVIQPTGEITFRQVDLKPLWQKHNASLVDLIIGNQEFLAVRSRSGSSFTKPQPNLPTLHQLLIDPIANLLPKDPNAHVIFIPQRSLFQVPFPALQDANGTYLIQKHTILTAPSIQVLALTRQQRQKLANQPANRRGKALVLGNPTMPQVSLSPGEPKQALSPLPGAEAEARAIASLLNTQAITGTQGTKAAIVAKMPQALIIHLATHGLLDDVQGLGSAIALAPSGNDDGLLTAEEIFDMKLQANLVVLSACNTGEGRITGDGVIGLSRSLISAGVPSVMVSLWSVPDAPTAELMQAFYQNLQKNPDKAQALRQAMLTTMKNHPQPRDWAAFTLIGEAE